MKLLTYILHALEVFSAFPPIVSVHVAVVGSWGSKVNYTNEKHFVHFSQ